MFTRSFQEVEVESGFNPNLLAIKNFDFELELNSVKSRVGIYTSKIVEYTRMIHLEGVDSYIAIMDISNCAIK